MKLTKQSTTILVISAVAVLILLWWNNGVAFERDRNATALKKEQQSVQTWKDEAGRSRGEVEAIKAERDLIKTVYESELDSLRRVIPEIGRKGKNLKEATNVTTITKDSIVLSTIFDTVVVDNNIVVRESLQYSDKWLDLEFDPLTNGLNYTSRDSLSIVKFSKRQGWFKPRTTNVQVISHNPRSSIIGLQQFSVEADVKRLSFGLQAGYGFTNNGMSPYVGIGFTWKLWK